MFAKDCSPYSHYLLAKDCGPCFLVSICKRLWSLSSDIDLQRTAVLVFCYSGPGSLLSICLQLATVLVFRCMLAKDSSPCYPLSICKGLLSLSFAICLQMTAALVSCHPVAKDCGRCFPVSICTGLLSLFLLFPCKRTAVLVFCHMIAKDYGPCLLLFICKGLWSLSSAFCDCSPCFRFSFAKDCCPCFHFLFAKDCGPCFLPFVSKGLWSLFPVSVCKD